MSRTYLADVTTANKRSSIFGTFNSISSLGFIIGPTIGGLLSSTTNGFYRVALLSSSLFVLNACFVMLMIPANVSEMLNKDEKKNDQNIHFFSSLNAFRDVSLIPWHAVWDVFTVRFLMSFALILFRSNFTSILVYRFSTDPVTNGYIMSFNGVIGALTGIMLRWIVPVFRSNSKLNDTFSVVTVISLFAITVAPSLTIVVLMIVPLCISSAVLRVTNQTAIYHKGGEKVRGLINGLGDTLTSLARAIAPAIAGCTQEVSIYGPGICGTLLAVAGTSVGIYAGTDNTKIHKE